MINVAIVGYGNLGHGVKQALENNKDTKLVALFSRRPEQLKKEIKDVPVLSTEKPTLLKNIKIDVAILCGGSKEDTPVQGPIFAKLFNTVDSFDTHADIPAYFQKIDSIAKKNKHVSVISAGTRVFSRWKESMATRLCLIARTILSGGRASARGILMQPEKSMV
jgi:diaminopimelate dehydrogenase